MDEGSRQVCGSEQNVMRNSLNDSKEFPGIFLHFSGFMFRYPSTLTNLHAFTNNEAHKLLILHELLLGVCIGFHSTVGFAEVQCCTGTVQY
jgi:type III secretory pathway component EscT